MKKIEYNKTFENFFTQKYKNGKMFTDIKIDSATFRKLKEFYSYYNDDNETKTLNRNKLTEMYKIITLQDILLIKGEIPKDIIDLNKPVDWSTFVSAVQDIIVERKYTYKDTENMLSELVNKVQNRKVNFKKYQKIYKNTFSKVFFRTIRDIFTVHTDIDFLINKEFKY
jgi:hypothetical protein